MYKGILVFTPDLRPSLMSVLKGLAQNGLLEKLVTTLAFNKRSFSGKLLGYFCNFLPLGMAKGISRRFLPEYLEGVTQSLYRREILRLLAGKSGSRVLAHRIWLWSELKFDLFVSCRYAGEYNCVYGTEHSSCFTFNRQKQRGGLVVLRQVMAHGRAAIDLAVRLAKAFPEYAIKDSNFFLEDMSRALIRKEEEYRLADLIVVNSSFVKDTFVQGGVSAEKIAIVPTGCPEVSKIVSKSGAGQGKLIFLFAGRLSLRKGIPYLLQAWRLLDAKNSAELWLAGEKEMPEKILKERSSGIRYFGALSDRELLKLYQQADVFVLPTLLEGLAYVILQAIAHGLPVISTKESGCGEFVQDSVNGLIIQAQSQESICKAMEWCLKNRLRLPAFGKASLEKARSWTLDDSNCRHLRLIKDFLENRGITLKDGIR